MTLERRLMLALLAVGLIAQAGAAGDSVSVIINSTCEVWSY